MNKIEAVKQILKGRPTEPCDKGYAFAPANIALCKYWGKRDEELNLPFTSSLSVSLGTLGAETTVTITPQEDRLTLNGEAVPYPSLIMQRLVEYLSLFRTSRDLHFHVETYSSIPLAAGLASSASGFAALVMALDHLFAWTLDKRELSILARMGSGSASRSLFPGFVKWHAGIREDGMDSYAELLPDTWPEFRIGLVMVSDAKKTLGSRPAMKRTVETSYLYNAWSAMVAKDMSLIVRAIHDHDFHLLGKTSESNALAMHATMIDSWPPILYWKPETVTAIQKVWKLREEGLRLFFTIDAGPNLKLLFLKDDQHIVLQHWPEIEIIHPFA